ncbi:Hypothetical protein NocV09_01101750 [Nannochloropsis oceanica]
MAATSNGQLSAEDEGDVFEIREWLDEDGKEVSSEVYSVREAARQVQALNLFGALEKAAKAKKEATTAAATAAEVNDAVNSHFSVKVDEVSTKTTLSSSNSGSRHKASNRHPAQLNAGGALPNVTSQLLDDHDWEGIKKRAKEIETLQRRSVHGELEAEADTAKGRDRLEGVGWGKGFFLNNEESKSTGKKDTNNASSMKGNLTVTTRHISSPIKSILHTKSSYGGSKKHVSFNLDSSPTPRHKPLEFLSHSRVPRPYQAEAEEEKDEEKRALAALRRQLQQRQQMQQFQSEDEEEKAQAEAFTGQVSEMNVEEKKEKGAGASDGACNMPAPQPTQRSQPRMAINAGAGAGARAGEVVTFTTGGGDRADIAPPGMSRFKARALGLTFEGDEEGSN